MSYSRIATDIERPFIVKAINACGRLMTLLGRDLVSLDEEKLMQAARKRTQLSDFGDEGFREGLTVFLRALKDEAELNGMGQVVAYQMCVNLLSGRLLIIDSIKNHPDILQEVIEKPLIIAGLPRTGTTILQQLLCADPQAR
ncbi:MAG: sulfotransferase, partial [Gammaproteobacteria bacterium]|nr:sulfotransferase [Gammaproteobacteria bacterium]